MKNDVIDGAAMLYYKENVEGEPLDQDTPFECFRAGALFVINAQKKRNNCNIPNETSYTNKKRNMDIYKKITENVEKISKVTGFYVTAPGDPSVGINPATWEIKNEFYFDTLEELEEFKKELKGTFEWYCGEVVGVVTFEEHQAELDADEKMFYEEFPVRYLIRYDENPNMYMRPPPFTGMYSGNVGECIHNTLPNWIDKDNPDVIPSTSDEYWKILKKELDKQQRNADVNGQHYHSAKQNINNLLRELNYGK